MFIKNFIFLFCLNHVLLLVKCRLIHTTTGPIIGKLNYYEKTRYYSYEGIPFAESPVGDLRFRPPVPIKPWKNVLHAFVPGPVCPQKGNTYRRSEMDEDCLFLNIYVPETAAANLPVLFFIHGGYFIVNSGRPDPIYGPQWLLEKGLIVVTTNYRLGALGFLSFDDTQASGNAGLKDILLASKWVKSNIAKFCGDQNQICLYGSGVGGTLAHYLLLTKQTSGIFHNAIIIAGSTLSYRGIQMNPIENALKLSRQLGIRYTDYRCIKKLKEIDAFDIVDAEQYILSNDPQRAFTLVNFFAPTIEKPSSSALITENPLDILHREGLVQNIPIFTGFNNNEGLEIFNVLRGNPNAVDSLNEDFELCIPPNIQYPIGSNERKCLAEAIREFYFGGKNISIFNVQNYINLITDTAYAYSIDYWIKLHKSKKRNSVVYYFIFEFDGQLNWGKLSNGINYPGACRADELGYIFLTKLTKDIVPNLDCRTRNRLENSLAYIKNFTIYGSPLITEEDGYMRSKLQVAALMKIGGRWTMPDQSVNFIDELDSTQGTKSNSEEPECSQWVETGTNRSHVIIDDEVTNVYEPPLQERLGFWYREYEKYYEYERCH